MAAPLQYDQAACLARLQATSTRGVPARLRRVAGCATPTGSAGHAGATANLKLTFHLDHSEGADQPGLRLSPRAYFQRAFAAVLAISFRRLADIPSARAFPPLRPNSTAAGSLPSSGVLRMTWTVLPITSAGRRSPLGPRGIFFTPVHCLAPSI